MQMQPASHAGRGGRCRGRQAVQMSWAGTEIGTLNGSPQPPIVRNVVPPNYRLRLPGPAAVPERVRAALAQPVLNHRGPEFRAVLAETTAGLRRIFGTRHDVLMFGSSGTGAMEAALANVLGPGDALLIVVAGQFGERFASIAES